MSKITTVDQSADPDAPVTGRTTWYTKAGELFIRAAAGAAVQVSGALFDLIQDTTPQLGGFLDAGDNDVRALKNCSFDSMLAQASTAFADIDFTTGQKFQMTLDNNPVITFTNPPGPCNLMLLMVQDATGSRTVSWPNSVKWPDGTAPTLSTAALAEDVIAFFYDGTNYYASFSLNFS